MQHFGKKFPKQERALKEFAGTEENSYLLVKNEIKIENNEIWQTYIQGEFYDQQKKKAADSQNKDDIYAAIKLHIALPEDEHFLYREKILEILKQGVTKGIVPMFKIMQSELLEEKKGQIMLEENKRIRNNPVTIYLFLESAFDYEQSEIEKNREKVALLCNDLEDALKGESKGYKKCFTNAAIDVPVTLHITARCEREPNTNRYVLVSAASQKLAQTLNKCVLESTTYKILKENTIKINPLLVIGLSVSIVGFPLAVIYLAYKGALTGLFEFKQVSSHGLRENFWSPIQRSSEISSVVSTKQNRS